MGKTCKNINNYVKTQIFDFVHKKVNFLHSSIWFWQADVCAPATFINSGQVSKFPATFINSGQVSKFPAIFRKSGQVIQIPSRPNAAQA